MGRYNIQHYTKYQSNPALGHSLAFDSVITRRSWACPYVLVLLTIFASAAGFFQVLGVWAGGGVLNYYQQQIAQHIDYIYIITSNVNIVDGDTYQDFYWNNSFK